MQLNKLSVWLLLYPSSLISMMLVDSQEHIYESALCKQLQALHFSERSSQSKANKENNAEHAIELPEFVVKSAYICEDTKVPHIQASINVPDQNGETPLFAAVKNQDVGQVRFLLHNGANPHKSKDGVGLLHLACYYGNLALVEQLLSFDSDLLQQFDCFGRLPIHIAAMRGSDYIVKCIYNKKKSSVFERDGNGNMPLHYAMAGNDIDDVNEHIISRSYCTAQRVYDKVAGPVMNHLAIGRFEKTCAFLIKKTNGGQCARNSANYTPCDIAAALGKSKLVELTSGIFAIIDPHSNYKFSLTYSFIVSEQFDRAKNLLAEFMNTSELWNFFYKAVIENNEKAFLTLVRLVPYSWKIIDNLTRRTTTLHLAAKANFLASADQLIRMGADVNAQDCEELTPLHAAVLNDSYACAKLLLDNFAYINAVTESWETPLMMSAVKAIRSKREHRNHMVSLLLMHGAREGDGLGYSPSELGWRLEDVMSLFLERGINSKRLMTDYLAPTKFARLVRIVLTVDFPHENDQLSLNLPINMVHCLCHQKEEEMVQDRESLKIILSFAIAKDWPIVVKYLSQFIEDISIMDLALQCAIYHNRMSIFKDLLNCFNVLVKGKSYKDDEINKVLQQLFRYAVRFASEAAIEELLKRGVYYNWCFGYMKEMLKSTVCPESEKRVFEKYVNVFEMLDNMRDENLRFKQLPADIRSMILKYSRTDNGFFAARPNKHSMFDAVKSLWL